MEMQYLVIIFIQPQNNKNKPLTTSSSLRYISERLVGEAVAKT